MRVRLRIFVAAALVMVGQAQGPWAKKDWKKWSKDDCKRMLEDSPWAHRWIQSDTKMANFATRTSGTEGVGSESELAISYLVQLRSALPVREAVVRQVMIANHYDRMESRQQKALLKQTEEFLNRNYDDVIVVHVIYASNVTEYNRDLATFWQTHYPEGTVPQEAFLNGPRGQKVAPVRLISPRGGAQEFELIFPRMIQGKPLIAPGDKTISVEFAAPAVGNIDSARVFVDFKVDKMVLSGHIIY